MWTDGELMKRIQERDAVAFAVFHARYDAAVERHILGMVHEAAIAEDLAQEVFLRVWTRAEQWQELGSCRSWLLRIATNLTLNHLRSLRRHPQEPLESQPRQTAEGEQEDDDWEPGWMADPAALTPEALLELGEQRAALHGLLSELSLEKREVFRLVHLLDLPIRDVAETLEIPEGTVKSRLYYARRELAGGWEKRWSKEEDR